MALINMREVYPDVLLGLWQMDETVDELFCNYEDLQRYRTMLTEKYKSDERKREFLCVRVLLQEMLRTLGTKSTLTANWDIVHNAAGKPLLKGYHISISHTKGFAAVILSKNKEVAVDIEYFSDRVQRIASKFMRKDEKAESLDELLVHWCGKETVYKLFSENNLQFSQMHVKPFDTMCDWACEVENLKSGKTVRVDFELTMEYVLTYTCLE